MMKEFNGDFLTVGLDCKGAKHNFLDTTTNIARWGPFLLGHHSCLVKSVMTTS